MDTGPYLKHLGLQKPKESTSVQKLRGGRPYTPQHFTPEEGGVAPRP